MDKDGFTKWVKQCRDYAVEIGLMEDGCDLTLGAYSEFDVNSGRDRAFASLSKDQQELSVKFEDAPMNKEVIIPLE